MTPQDIQKYYTMLLRKKGLSPNTIRRHHDLLSASLHMAVRQEVLPFSPTDRVEPPRQVPHEAHFYGPEELRRLCALAEGTWLELIVKLAAGLGLRREEICGLRWPSVDLQQRVVFIREARTAAGARIIQKETKTKASTRTLYLSDEIYRLLVREQQRQQEDCLRLGRDWDGEGMVVLDSRGAPAPPTLSVWLSLASSRRTDCPRSPCTACATHSPPWPPLRGPISSTSGRPWATPPPPPPAVSIPTCWTRPMRASSAGWRRR